MCSISDLGPFLDIELPFVKPFDTLTKAEARQFYKWYLTEFEANTERKIREGFGIEPAFENVKEISRSVYKMLSRYVTMERLPEELLAKQRDSLGEKWQFLYKEEDLSAQSIGLAIALSFVDAWCIMKLMPGTEWRLCTQQSYYGFNEPVLWLPHKTLVPPISSTINLCYVVHDNPDGFDRVYLKLLRLTGHLVD